MSFKIYERNSNHSPKKALIILSSVGVNGGVPNKVMDIYRNIDKEKIQFDFLIYTRKKNNFRNEINKLGGNVYFFGSIKEIGFIKFHMKFYELLSQNKYDIIHSYNSIYDTLLLMISNIKDVKTRISHSRGSDLNSKIVKIFLPILRFILIYNSTKLLSCSKEAGEFLFKNKQFEIVPNPIDVNRFINVKKSRVNNLRKELCIKGDDFIIGHIGRFSIEKNQKFLVYMANKLKNINMKFKMVFVGDGNFKAEIISLVKELNLENEIIILNTRKDIEVFYHIFDVFLFPSKHEGFGNVAVESQLAGTPVIASTRVPNDVDLELNLVKFIDLEFFDIWIENIINFSKENISLNKKEILKRTTEKGFNLNSVIDKHYRFYNIKK